MKRFPCPTCGAFDWIFGTSTTGHFRDAGLSMETHDAFDEERGVSCKACGFQAGSESPIQQEILDRLGEKS